MNKKDRLDLVKWAMNYAQKKDADQVAVSLINNREIVIEFRDKKIEKLQESSRMFLSLNVYCNHRFSGHSTSDMRKESLEKFIQEAVESTKYLAQDKYRSLPDPKWYPVKKDIDLMICDNSYEDIESSKRVQITAEIEEAAMAQSKEIISTTAAYNDIFYEKVQVHSNGFEGEIVATHFSAGAEVTVRDEQGKRPEDWFYASARFQNDLPHPEFIGKNAAQKALRKIGQEKIDSGQYDMIVENRAGRRLVDMLYRPMRASALQQKRSFLEGMVGRQIASDKLTIIDDPFIEKGFGTRLFDSEGLAAKRRTIVQKGVLKEYFIDNYYGRKLKMEPNSGSTSNLLFDYGEKSFEEMILEIEKGILITSFIGGNSNSTTGDFSFGISGLLIENGKIIKPVNEMNISGNALEFWNRLEDMGNDPYPYSSWQTPSMYFKDVYFSGF
jgi:PmbA protein